MPGPPNNCLHNSIESVAVGYPKMVYYARHDLIILHDRSEIQIIFSLSCAHWSFAPKS